MSVFLAGLVLSDLADKSIHHQGSFYEQEVIITDPPPFPVHPHAPEEVEELVYNADNLRDRLILELQARCGLRIGEALKITVKDVSARRSFCEDQSQEKSRRWPSCRNKLRTAP
jgi:integrase